MRTEIEQLASRALARDSILNSGVSITFKSSYLMLFLLLFFTLFAPLQVVAQDDRNFTIWGDVKIDDSKAEKSGPLTLTVILYDQRGRLISRQIVTSRGRYRFTNLEAGEYDIVIEGESGEITRVRLAAFGPSGTDFRQDFEFEWKEKITESKSITGVISAADVYERSSSNKSLFQKAQQSAEKKKYAEAATYLRQILENDKMDFQAWSLLGTIYLAQEKPDEAEKAYKSSLEVKPTFGLALLNLGRLLHSQRRFEESIAPLTKAVEVQPQSGIANLLLGEAYLHIKKGSKAIPYLNEAAKLGMEEAHLRLAWLYNAAGLKEKAAVEYEEFLKKKPQYPERKKLEQYISANKKG